MRVKKIKAIWPLCHERPYLSGIYKIKMKGWLWWLIPGNIKLIKGEHGINHWLGLWGRFKVSKHNVCITHYCLLDYSQNKWPIRLILDEVRVYTNSKGESTIIGKFMWWKLTGWFTMTPTSIQPGIPH